MKKYGIWVEGFSVTGNNSKASYIGESYGESFEDAVKNFTYPKDIKREWCAKNEDPILIHKGDKLTLDTDDSEPDGYRRHMGSLCSWACRYFDNEIDARKSFG